MDMQEKGRDQLNLLSGYCPDEKCQAKLFFPAFDPSIECTDCGQRHERSTLRNVEVVTNPEVALHNIIRNMLVVNTKPKKGTDSVKVLGLSNYHCKLLSPLLTKYGMDKNTGKAKLLEDLNQGNIFDCAVLSNRAFLIDPEHINIIGYGLDISGSAKYLDTTLQMIKKYNNNEELLIPLHADGDGHCLVHAISRTLIGRELFWHPLRSNLKAHFQNYSNQYKKLFNAYYNDKDWEDIIAECDPYFHPSNGEPLGLRNIHVFGLANVLRRPIILLDSFSGMQSSGDYSATFLPELIEPSLCQDKDKVFNKPLCIAWSSSGHNHYIPLVGIKGRNLPRLPSELVPKAWGVPQLHLFKYVDIPDNRYCILGGDRITQDRYILRLAAAMEEVFFEKYHVHPALVADIHHYVFKRTGLVGVQPQVVIEATQKSVNEHRLFRCLLCDAVCEMMMCPEWFKPGGIIYSWVERNDKLEQNKRYSIPSQGLTVVYDAEKNELIPENKQTQLKQCNWCQGHKMRLVKGDGSIVYQDGDRTNTRSTNSNCNCGFKHYWNGKEYDNLPQIVTVTLDWNNTKNIVKVPWFQNESDTMLNSNAYNIAAELVNQYYPGVFGSERLVQKIVDQILHQVASSPTEQKPITLEDMPAPLEEQSPTKIIMSGKHIVHKEELTKSQIEKKIKKQIEENAPLYNRRASGDKMKTPDKPVTSGAVRKVPSPAKSLGSPSPTSGHSNYQQITPSSSNDQFPKPTPSVNHDLNKKIRVSTSDGKQVMLTLEATTTFKELQTKIEGEFNVPVYRQRLRVGFPPRPLLPHEDENEPLSLQHGDKVAVEIISDPLDDTHPDNIETKEQSSEMVPPWKQANIREEFLKSIETMPGGDSLDSTISALPLIASLMGRDTWGLVQTLPHLFGPNGFLYQQIHREFGGLTDNHHYRIPILPGKVFRYNGKCDRLELCLETYGHFAIEAGIEDRVLQQQRTTESSQGCASTSSAGFTAGNSGAIKQKDLMHPAGHVPFSGKGHTLNISSSKSTNSVHTSSQLDHIDEDMDTDMDIPPLFHETLTSISNLPQRPRGDLVVKKGSGYSVTSSIPSATITNDTKTNNEMLPEFTSRIENSLQDDDSLQIEEEKCEDPDQLV